MSQAPPFRLSDRSAGQVGSKGSGGQQRAEQAEKAGHQQPMGSSAEQSAGKALLLELPHAGPVFSPTLPLSFTRMVLGLVR
jgi:hypothetical protein